MNSTTEELKNRWARKRFQRAMQQYQAIMETHTDKIETEKGMMSMVMVSGIAQLVARGLESQVALAHTIKQASKMSGIPEDALAAYAQFSSEMMTCYEFDQQLNKSPR